VTTPDERHAELVAHFTRLQNQVWDMHTRKEVFEALDDEMVRRRPAESAYFIEMFRALYADAQVMLVRRLVDQGRRTDSFVRLLIGMKKAAPTVLTRARYFALYGLKPDDTSHWARRADEDFDRWTDSPSDPHVSKGYLQRLHDDVVRDGQIVKDYVDSQVAHRSQMPSSAITWGDLNRAIGALSGDYTRAGVLLTASHHDPEPAIQDNWRKAFMPVLFTPPLAERSIDPNGWTQSFT
jgi:hypothetical protein